MLLVTQTSALTSKELVSVSYQKIKQGSKSFHFASLFLSPKIRRRAWYLYAWCRVSDDLIDNATSLDQALSNLDQLNRDIDQVYQDSQEKGPADHSDSSVIGIHQLKLEVNLSSVYLKDLLRGYRMDLEGFTARPKSELLDYCYCVAGTVGLMMCEVMEVTDPKALGHAKDLGIAMQLTNIIRDIQSDLSLGRVYIPQEFFVQHNLNVSDFYSNPNGVSVTASKYLFDLAETYYQSGHLGLKYLPMRERIAIAVASITYRKIGLEVLKRGERAWSQRTFTTPLQKLLCAIKGVYLAATAR